MRLGGERRHVQVLGDLGVAAPTADLDEHFTFAVGQALELFAVFVGGWSCDEFADQATGDRWCDQRIARCDDADGVEELVGCGVFEQEPRRAGSQRRVNVLVEVERGEHEDPCRVEVVVGGDQFGGCDPVEVGHPHVHQHDVGSRSLRFGDGLSTVGGLRDDFEVGLGIDQSGEAAPHELLVVGDDDADGPGDDVGRVVGHGSSQ